MSSFNVSCSNAMDDIVQKIWTLNPNIDRIEVTIQIPPILWKLKNSTSLLWKLVSERRPLLLDITQQVRSDYSRWIWLHELLFSNSAVSSGENGRSLIWHVPEVGGQRVSLERGHIGRG